MLYVWHALSLLWLLDHCTTSQLNGNTLHSVGRHYLNMNTIKIEDSDLLYTFLYFQIKTQGEKGRRDARVDNFQIPENREERKGIIG